MRYRAASEPTLRTSATDGQTVLRGARQAMAIVIAIALFGPVFASEEKLIRLGDGSEIRRQVISLKDGTYTIRTNSLGTIRLRSDKIMAISSVAPESTSSVNQPSASAVESLRADMAADTTLMGGILKLQDDPAMKAVLSDPEVMRAVKALDFQALARHPKIKALMASPEMKSIQSRVR